MTMTDDPNGSTPADQAVERLAKIAALREKVVIGSTGQDMLELAMAVAISQRVVPDGPPVWLLFEGPPASGKTLVVNLLRDLEKKPDSLTVFVPKVTLGSLTSGFKDSKSGKRAPALLTAFDKGCWCNTEFSTLMTGRPESVAPVLGVLTAAFDGDLSAAFGNVVEQGSPVLTLKSRFSLLGCITPQVRQQHSRLLSQLGPRFLSYRLLPLTDEERERAFRAVGDPYRAAGLTELQSLVAVHVRGVLKNKQRVTVSEEAEQVLRLLAQLVAAGRTPVIGGAVEASEDPLRAFQQLRALGVALARVHGTPTVSARALRLVRDVALSSFEPNRAEALVVQRTSPVLAYHRLKAGERVSYVHGMTASQLADETGWSDDRAKRALTELEAAGLYTRADRELVLAQKPPTGRPSTLYVPAPGLSCVLNATFEDYPPRLITVPALFAAEPGAFEGRLSPPDARLAAGIASRGADLTARIREAGSRLLRDRPDLDSEQLVLLALGEVLGVPLEPVAGDAS